MTSAARAALLGGPELSPADRRRGGVTHLCSQGTLIAAAFAVLDRGGDGDDVGLVAAARTLPLVLFSC